jgi:hypothetical protein
MQPVGRQHIGFEQIMPRFPHAGGMTDQIGQCRQAEIAPLAGEALALPVQRRLLCTLVAAGLAPAGSRQLHLAHQKIHLTSGPDPPGRLYARRAIYSAGISTAIRRGWPRRRRKPSIAR